MKTKSLPCRQASVKSQNLYKSVIQTSYDIVKTHGGEIKVISDDESAGTEFTIDIPVKLIE